MSALPRPLFWLLVGSLALNLFFAGFVAARFTFGPRHAGPPPMSGPENLFAAAEAAGGRQVMRQLFQARRAAFQQDRKGLRQARAQVASAMEREPFDPRQLRAALGGLRTQTAATQATLHDVLVEFASDLSPEQRKRLVRAAALHVHPQRGRGKGAHAPPKW